VGSSTSRAISAVAELLDHFSEPLNRLYALLFEFFYRHVTAGLAESNEKNPEQIAKSPLG